jgi:hypothetical protein
MCEYTKAGAGVRLAMMVLCDNGEREYYRRSNPHSRMTGGTAGRWKPTQRLNFQKDHSNAHIGHHHDFAHGFSRTSPLTGPLIALLSANRPKVESRSRLRFKRRTDLLVSAPASVSRHSQMS